MGEFLYRYRKVIQGYLYKDPKTKHTKLLEIHLRHIFRIQFIYTLRSYSIFNDCLDFGSIKVRE